MRAYVLVHVRTGEEYGVIRALKSVPGIIRVDFTFGPYDIIAEVEAPTLEELGMSVSENIRCQPGVTDTLTCLAITS
ncbi:MAG: AsnC family protein [Chloroflexi bacterium ADurb.Bin325]|nr:MAG: AsnC family protein [Chloroflexi bacterium ADurb.Bin325]